jgi:tetratricopeptide (TPR) repeat protein
MSGAHCTRGACLAEKRQNDTPRLTRKALPLYESIATALPGDSDAQRDLAIGLRNVGKALTINGDPPAAMPYISRAVDLLKELTTEHPDSAFLARQLVFTHYAKADAILISGDAAASLEDIGKGIRIGRALMNKDASNMVALRTLAMEYAHAGRAAEALATKRAGRWSEARGWFVRSREAWAEHEKRGEIPSTNVPHVEQVREATARCDAALARRAS